jgi:two-component system invasion response regulator UvrY
MFGSARKRLRILILDDHAIVRLGVRQILHERFDGLEFGEGKAGPEGLDLALGQVWDLVTVAIGQSNRKGRAVLTKLKSMRPGQQVLVLSDCASHVDVANNPGDLALAVRRVLVCMTNGQPTRDREITSNLERVRAHSSHESLSTREREVLRLIGLGNTVKQIAAILGLSDKTISTYRSRTLVKLRLKTTADLILYAVLNRLAS